METIISQYLLLIYVPIGAYVAHRICPDTNFFLRVIMLLPVFTVIATINQIIMNEYNAQLMDLLREISSLITYILLAFLLTGKRILKNIDSEKPCERETK